MQASEPVHNSILLAVAELILKSGVDLRVRHIEGKKNVRADMLSRLLFDEYHHHFPADRIRTFSPPIAGAMEGVFLNLSGGSDGLLYHSRPPVDLQTLDNRLALLQANALDESTLRGYAVGARDYIRFCLQHHLPLERTPLTLARYIAYMSQFITSGPHYLSGARHYLQDLFPNPNANRNHQLVKNTIRGSRKLRANSIQ